MLLTIAWGCSIPAYRPESTTGDPTPVILPGDWDDSNAVAIAATVRARIAVEAVETPDDRTKIFRLSTYAGRPGWLSMRRLRNGFIEIIASVGNFGDDELEALLIESIETRFVQLRGNVAAPIDWDD